jgi:hypothetical protein
MSERRPRLAVAKRTRSAPPLCGRVRGTAWEQARPVRIDEFPWPRPGERQPTTVRLLYDADAVYVQFRCRDRHIFSRVTDLNGPVCQDSCVEFFATVNPAAGPHYFNLEVNCCGHVLLGFGPERRDRKAVSPDLARRLTVAASEPGPTREESAGDRGWWVAAAVPFAVIEKMAGTPLVRPGCGSEWRANFYRCGGKTGPQYACWNPVVWEHPDFHRPEFFGRLRFD